MHYVRAYYVIITNLKSSNALRNSARCALAAHQAAGSPRSAASQPLQAQTNAAATGRCTGLSARYAENDSCGTMYNTTKTSRSGYHVFLIK